MYLPCHAVGVEMTQLTINRHQWHTIGTVIETEQSSSGHSIDASCEAVGHLRRWKGAWKTSEITMFTVRLYNAFGDKTEYY